MGILRIEPSLKPPVGGIYWCHCGINWAGELVPSNILQNTLLLALSIPFSANILTFSSPTMNDTSLNFSLLTSIFKSVPRGEVFQSSSFVSPFSCLVPSQSIFFFIPLRNEKERHPQSTWSSTSVTAVFDSPCYAPPSILCPSGFLVKITKPRSRSVHYYDQLREHSCVYLAAQID